MEIFTKEKGAIRCSQDVAKIFRAILAAESEVDRDKEHFWSVGLTTINNIKYIELVSLGVLNMNFVHPREVFRLAILKAVDSIIVCHNHPSGAVQPSPQDEQITTQLVEAGKIIGITVIDHIIIGNGVDGQYSFADNLKIER